MPFLLIQMAFAWWQLTSANYIEHYGLLREKRPDGRYERCQPHHSWNANHMASNLVTFHLERHSDHHAFAARRYQSSAPLRRSAAAAQWLFRDVPAVLYSALWRRVMDPKVLALAEGDMSRINTGELSQA